jgi:hypothetical protein
MWLAAACCSELVEELELHAAARMDPTATLSAARDTRFFRIYAAFS